MKAVLSQKPAVGVVQQSPQPRRGVPRYEITFKKPLIVDVLDHEATVFIGVFEAITSPPQPI